MMQRLCGEGFKAASVRGNMNCGFWSVAFSRLCLLGGKDQAGKVAMPPPSHVLLPREITR